MKFDRRSRHPADSLDQTFDDHSDHPVRQIEDLREARPTESVLHGELEEMIERALNDLPEKQRTAVLLCRQDELSYEEIAEVIGCSLSATKSLIHRARETLKERLKPICAPACGATHNRATFDSNWFYN
jgi:RNA polymerase sigma-70 factor (ECF subfamily)